MAVAKLLEKWTHEVPGKLDVSELYFEVPLDHSKPEGETLRLFARSVERHENLVDLSKKEDKKLPWMVYLQGGPGLPCKSPQNYGWVDFVLDKGYQILFLDQRGTGLSSTVSAETLAKKGDSKKQASYVKHFRADSIVLDCEAIRKLLTADFPEAKKKWSTFGWSFGGFCTIHYLSKYPEGLRECFLGGGLAPLSHTPDEIYTKLFDKVRERNQAYYRKYPEDVKRVKEIVRVIQKGDIKLPSGGTLSVSRFRQMGEDFGFHGGLDVIHEMVFRMANDLKQFGFFTRPTLISFDSALPFDSVPMYALVHEALYCQGFAAKWSADRVLHSLPEFMNVSPDSKDPIFFTGEMIFKANFDDYDGLRSLKATVDILANDADWPTLYDEKQLAKNEVPVYCATFVDDMYVHFDFAQETASKIKGCKQYITNAMYHDALVSRKAEEMMKSLFALREDTID